jgi:hypothetical protein
MAYQKTTAQPGVKFLEREGPRDGEWGGGAGSIWCPVVAALLHGPEALLGTPDALGLGGRFEGLSNGTAGLRSTFPRLGDQPKHRALPSRGPSKSLCPFGALA